jgi:hypothetical protein
LEICISGKNGAVSKQTIHLLRPTDSAETTAHRGSRLSCPRYLSPTRKRQQAGGGRENEQGEGSKHREDRTQGNRTNRRTEREKGKEDRYKRRTNTEKVNENRERHGRRKKPEKKIKNREIKRTQENTK